MRRLHHLLAIGALVLISTMAAATAQTAHADDPAPPAFTATKTMTRDHLVNGADQVVDSRTVKVSVDSTDNLRDRQAIRVSWTGAHPTGGLIADHNSALAAQQEYPVVIMQCRGVDSATAPVDQQVSPQTCWTQSPAERFQSNTLSNFPSYRMDRYADPADRVERVGQPNPLPAACSGLDTGSQHWIPFKAADGTVYYGGQLGCAGMAPEAANLVDSLQPGNTTYAPTDTAGNGSTKFVIQTADSNASVGCSATVACSLVVIPIMGISCDAAATSLPVADQPPVGYVDPVHQDCARSGIYQPGEYSSGSNEVEDLPVAGELWWSASNWRNRISVPLTFSQSASVCDVVNSQAPEYLYGTQTMLQATQQWSPAFCLDSTRFKLQHVQTSEPQAKNLVDAGSIKAALAAGPPNPPFSRPIVQAPAAVTGYALVYSIDDAKGLEYHNLKLNARLLAKLLTESYPSNQVVAQAYKPLSKNPIDVGKDPEFQALNPGVATEGYHLEPASTLFAMSSDSDVMSALTSYINADPEARAWLDGKADPWGMVVNPAYTKIALPTSSWPQLDTFIAKGLFAQNICLSTSPVPWLPLVAAPVSNPALITLNMQFDIAASQIVCKDPGPAQKLVGVGREAPGNRFLIGLVSLADAARYQLNTASLQTTASNSGAKFSDSSGRTFVGPTDAAMKATTSLLKFDPSIGTWPVPYTALRSDANAYPGTLLITADIPTQGLPATDAARYSSLLRFMASDGQSPGLGSGKLPPGYLPMTAANGLADFVKYAGEAADAVAAQQGHVPRVPKPTTPSTPSDGPGSVPSTVPAASGSGTSTPAAPGSSASTSKRSTAAPTLTAGPKASVTAAQPVGRTSALNVGALGLALPALAVLALVAAAASSWFSGFGRR